VSNIRKTTVTPLAALLFGVLLGVPAPTPLLADSKPVHAPHAIVVSIDELASKAGAEIMQAGGNAIDAEVATGFALAVVYPQAGNLGGGGFMLVRMADGKTHFIDFREEAPAAATARMYLGA
jgi:gamma-glutamyltranspeptidase/glutathione hydrolase